METSNSIEHLETILSDIKALIENKLDFNAFLVLVLGIEYLGNFSDEKDFRAFKQSEIRFKNGLEYFKNEWYKKNKELLFKELRGPLIHQYRPGVEIVLTSVCKNNAPIEDHLKKVKETSIIILVLEKLFEDFEEAVKRFKNIINNINNNLNKEKLTANYSSLPIIQSPTTDNKYICTGFTENIIVKEDDNLLLKKTRKEKRKQSRKTN